MGVLLYVSPPSHHDPFDSPHRKIATRRNPCSVAACDPTKSTVMNQHRGKQPKPAPCPIISQRKGDGTSTKCFHIIDFRYKTRHSGRPAEKGTFWDILGHWPRRFSSWRLGDLGASLPPGRPRAANLYHFVSFCLARLRPSWIIRLLRADEESPVGDALFGLCVQLVAG